MGKNPAQKAKSTEDKKPAERKEKTASKKKVVAASATQAKTPGKCRIQKCKRTYRAKGYCGAHYQKWRQGEYGVARYKTCSDFGCKKAKVMNRQGYCEDHYQNYYVKGMEVTKAPVAEKPAPPKEAAPKAAATA